MTNEEFIKIKDETEKLLTIYNAIGPINETGFSLELLKEAYSQMMDFIMPAEKLNFLSWMDRFDFWKTPASTRFHGNFESGLAVHTMQVIIQSLKFAPALLSDFLTTRNNASYSITAKDIFVSALAHDFCKSDVYETSFRNTKDYLGNWVKKPYYKTKDNSRNLGHGNESVLRLLEIEPSYIKNRVVLEAVSRHMGFSDLTDTEMMNYSNFLENPVVLLIQLADQSASAWYGN